MNNFSSVVFSGVTEKRLANITHISALEILPSGWNNPSESPTIAPIAHTKLTATIFSGEYSFSYCHSDPNFIVKVGDEVKKGQVIGKVGPKNVYGVPGNPYKDSQGNPTNGATTGCHCHFTVKKNGETIDPLTILK